MILSPVQYFGGKSNLLPVLLPIINATPHRIYNISFGGSASTLLNKNMSLCEYYNDIDGRMVNFFKVCCHRLDELIELLEWTPYSRQAFNESIPVSPDPVEDAHRVFVLLNQGGNGRMSDPAWHRTNHHNPAQGSRPRFFRNKLQQLEQVRDRLSNVYFEQTNAIELIQYLDHEDTLQYLDPPYMPDTRTAVRYSHDMTVDDHISMLEILPRLKSYIILSGYDNDIYNSHLSGWYKQIIKNTQTRGAKKDSKKATRKNEVIWCNFTPRNEYKQNSLF